MDNFLTNNMAELFIAGGIVLMAIEAGIMGFSTLFLFFIGAGALLSGVAMTMGWMETDLTSGIVSMAIIALVLAVLLWKPMKTLQASGDDPAKPHSDFVGMTFELTSELSSKQVSSYKYSGILWTVRAGVPIPEPLTQGTTVTVTSVEVGTLYVAPV